MIFIITNALTVSIGIYRVTIGMGPNFLKVTMATLRLTEIRLHSGNVSQRAYHD